MEKGAKNNLIVRTLSGLLMLVIVPGATLLSPWTFALLVGVICIVSMWEFYGLAEKSGTMPNKILGMSIGLLAIISVTVISLAGGYVHIIIANLGFILCALLLFVTFAAELFRNKPNPTANVGATLMGVLYIALPLVLLIALPSKYIVGNSLAPASWGDLQPWCILWFIFIIWMNDVGAYIIGVSFGRHRLFERISPKKSWEGFFGGLAFGIGTGALAATVMGWDVWFWIGLAVIAVITGVLGDLIESMFKRAAGVKDSGNLIPGHGGMLDRFDALIFSTPFVFTYFTIFA